MILMIATVICYTICSLSDKYAISKARFSCNEFTFLMSVSTSLFMLFALPFTSVYFNLSWQTGIMIVLVSVLKFLEFQTCAKVLTELSAFELKAWLGITLFFSYVTDLIFGSKVVWFKFFFIAVTLVGLFMIARAGKQGAVHYRKIVIPLVIYLFVKYGYGLTMRVSKTYISGTLLLLISFVIITLFFLRKVNPKELFEKNSKGTIIVGITKIPNVVGMLTENAVIMISLSNYSFIQPMILCVLFFVSIFRKEQYNRANFIGGVICIIGIIGFQMVR